MTDQHDFERWREIREVQKNYIDFYKLLGAGILVFIGVVIGRSLNPAQVESFDVNLITEIIGIAVTVFIINWFSERREEKKLSERKILDLQQQLLEEAASTSNEIARHAISIIERRNWLKGQTSLLQGANLTAANLRQVSLRGANLSRSILRRTVFRDANLEGASMVHADLTAAKLETAHLSSSDMSGACLKYASMKDAWIYDCFLDEASLVKADMTSINAHWASFRRADLSEADLIEADLECADLADANLNRANLQNANLKNANFERASLQDADLRGASLIGADLEGVQFTGKTKFDMRTILPNGQQWQNITDLTIFTDREHPMFWREKVDQESAAYEGKYT